MSTITFLFQGVEIEIQCSKKEKFETIIKRFCEKVKVNRNQVNFLSKGKILDEQMTEDQVPFNIDNKKFVTVDDNSDYLPADVIIKSKDIICPKCKEFASISIDDNYKISIINCKNVHKTENILISEFEETQNINISKIKCDKCKNNMGSIFNHEFYKCINCKMNLCPLCKKEHSLYHNIILYENKYYICDEHGEAFISYCNECKTNLCFTCEEKHNGHDIIDFKKLRKNKNDLEKELDIFKEYIDKAKKIVEEDIKNYREKWNKVINNYEKIYKIKKEIFISMEQSLRNLQKLINQDFIIKKYEEDFLSIINTDKIDDRYTTISTIYEEMESKEEKFNNIIYYDESYDNNNINISNDIDYFERITNGAFFLCSNINSLELIKKEINQQIEKENNIKFNLIIKAIESEQIIELLINDVDLKKIINKICIFCGDLNRWPSLKNINNIIFRNYSQKVVTNFINRSSSKNIKPFPIVKLITYDDYINKYKEKHKKLSYFYGNLYKDTYKRYFEEMKILIKDLGNKDVLRKKANRLLYGFMNFEIKNNLDEMNRLIIKEYTKDTICFQINSWLIDSKMNVYDTIQYFSSRLMHSLNTYGKEHSKFYSKISNVLYHKYLNCA